MNINFGIKSFMLFIFACNTVYSTNDASYPGIYYNTYVSTVNKNIINGIYFDQAGDGVVREVRKCIIFFKGTKSDEPSKFKSSFWYAGHPEDQITGLISFDNLNNKQLIKIKVNEDMPGCENFYDRDFMETQGELLITGRDCPTYGIISVARSYFYTKPMLRFRSKQYSIEDDVVCVTETKGEWLHIEATGKIQMAGWIKSNDVQRP